jgi:hypothetical protein
MGVVVERLDASTVRKTSEGGYAPSFRCDACGKEIPKPEKGRAAWDPDENRTYLSVALLHRGCVEDYRDGRGKDLRTADLADFAGSLERFAAGPGR